MQYLDPKGVINIIQNTLNQVDVRLMDHGKRVSYLVFRMLRAYGRFTDSALRNFCFLSLLHDIGAYKTEEVSNMLCFENDTPWEHAIYGSLFIKHFSPLQQLAPVVLYHHADTATRVALPEPQRMLAEILYLADRADMFFASPAASPQVFFSYVASGSFLPDVTEMFIKSDLVFPIEPYMQQDEAFWSLMHDVPFTDQQLEGYLKMVVLAIDFRSRHTVTHTISTANISSALAHRLTFTPAQRRRIELAALVHDLGKISIPVEILESSGKLNETDMHVMRTHVEKTEEILKGCIDPMILRIAVHHHEKLDGSGYPRGVGAKDLSLSDRVLAVADIVSALYGVRSYKAAYSKEKTLRILHDMCAGGLIDRRVTAQITNDFDAIMEQTNRAAQPVLRVYDQIQNEYMLLRDNLAKRTNAAV